MKLALGTAQFGMAYGVSNESGRVDERAAADILDYARGVGIDTIDTAIGYGVSEATLGQAGIEGFRVITKLPEVPTGISDVGTWLHSEVEQSMARLKVGRLAALLLHRPLQLLDRNGQDIARALESLKQQGSVEKIGVSIYDPNDMARIFDVCSVDIVQAPFNIVDRRLADSGWLTRLSASGVEVHVRSLFLQGLLLMSPSKMPERFQRWSSLWSEWANWNDSHAGIGPAAACLAFARKYQGIDRLVVGIDNVAQLEQLAHAMTVPIPASLPELSCTDESLINPGKWSVN